jgi:hypothetical protein
MDDGNLELLNSYERIFRERFSKRLAEYESLWIKAAADKPENKWFFDVHLSQLNKLKTHLPRIAREVANFIDKIYKTSHNEVLDELDNTLAQRERNFSQMLVAMIRDSWRLARLERARGRVVDFEHAIGNRLILRNGLAIRQLAGENGYLDLPETLPNPDYGSAIANDLASAMWGSFKSTRRNVPLLFVTFYLRYFLDVMRRNRTWVIVTFGIFTFGAGYIIEKFELRIFRGAFFVLLAAFIGSIIFERFFKHRWLELHKIAMRQATTQLYISFFDFELERASLEVMHKLSDPKTRQELQRSNRVSENQ